MEEKAIHKILDLLKEENEETVKSWVCENYPHGYGRLTNSNRDVVRRKKMRWPTQVFFLPTSPLRLFFFQN